MQRLRPVLSILFMVLAFVAAYGLDRWTSYARWAFLFSLERNPELFALVASALLQVAVWTFLAWWILAGYTRWYMSLIFFLAGLVVLLYPPLRDLSGLEFLRYPFRFSYDPEGRLAFTGAFIAALGILSWLLSRRKWSKDESV